MTTAKLELPELVLSQSQPHIPHNAALRRLEAVTQLSVIDRSLNTPPSNPPADAYYLVAPSATGAWAGHDDEIAYAARGAWQFLTPIPGWIAYVQDEQAFVYYTGQVNTSGTAWEGFPP